MRITLDLPEDIAAHQAAQGENLSRAALEGFALEAYRALKLTRPTSATAWQVDHRTEGTWGERRRQTRTAQYERRFRYLPESKAVPAQVNLHQERGGALLGGPFLLYSTIQTSRPTSGSAPRTENRKRD